MALSARQNIIISILGTYENLKDTLNKAKNDIADFKKRVTSEIVSIQMPEVGASALYTDPKTSSILNEILNKTVGTLNRLINVFQTSETEGIKALTALRAKFDNAKDSVDNFLRSTEGFKQLRQMIVNLKQESSNLSETMNKKVGGILQELDNRFGGFGTTLGRVGKRASWFGFRLAMMGRQMTRGMLKPIKKALGLFTAWDKTIGDIGLGLGMLAATGQLTGESQESLMNAMNQLVTTGPKVQGLFAAMQAAFINMAGPIIDVLYPHIMTIIDAFNLMWSENKENLIPMLEQLATETVPKIIDAIKTFGPVFINSFIGGFQKGVDALIGFINHPAVQSFLPWLFKIAGFMTGLAPLMVTVGTVLFGLAIPFQLVSSLIAGLSGILKVFTGKGLGALITSSPLVKKGLGLILTKFWQFKGAIVGVLPKVAGFATKALGFLGPHGLLIAGVIAGVALLFTAWKNNWFGIRDKTKAAIDGIKGFLSGLKEKFDSVLKGLQNFWDKITGGWKKSKDALEEYQEADAGLNQQLESEYGQSIGDVMASQFDTAREALENLMEATHTTTVVPQTIPITISVDVGTLSSDVDINMLVDEMSRQLANKLEGVYSR